MNIPLELAENLLEHINLAFLAVDPYSHDSEQYMSSATYHMKNCFNISWSEGGTYGSCWNDKLTKVASEDEPEMTVLKDFFDKYYPDTQLSFEIESYVEYDSDSERDYYSGQTYTGRKHISFEQLADAIVAHHYQDCEEFVDFDSLLYQHSTFVVNMSLEDYPNLKFKKELEEKISIKSTSHIQSKI